MPADDAEGLAALFEEVLDGRNIATAEGVQQALGRPARGLTDSARRAAWRELRPAKAS